MDITLIAIALFIFLGILFLFLFLLKSLNKKLFKAADGSLFKNQSDLNVYQSLYEKTKPLFSVGKEKGSGQILLGFEKTFLIKLTSEGFQDLKTLVKYRDQIRLLSDLMNT